MRTASLLVLALACKPDEGDTADSTATAADTGPTEPTPTGGADTDATGTSPTVATETSPGTAGDDARAALDAACEAYCAVYDACPDTLPGECLGVCLGSIVERCVDEGVAYLGCLAEQTCDTLLNGPEPCLELDAALEEATCFRFCEGTALEPGVAMCALEIQCTEEPLRRVECTPDGCVCIVEGIVVKSCPEGSCTPEEQLPSVHCCDL